MNPNRPKKDAPKWLTNQRPNKARKPKRISGQNPPQQTEVKEVMRHRRQWLDPHHGKPSEPKESIY